MADARAEANRKTALREAAINATLNHPYIVTTYTYDMQPLGDPNTAGRGFLDWQVRERGGRRRSGAFSMTSM